MSKLIKVSAIFAIAGSVCMILFWAVNFFFKFSGSELQLNSVSFWILIFDEGITSALLFAGGLGLLMQKKWAKQVFYTSMGMMLYAVIFASGVFAKIGNYLICELFIIVAVATAIILIIHLFAKKE